MLYLIGIGMFCLTLISLVAMSLNKDFSSTTNTDSIKHKIDITNKKDS